MSATEIALSFLGAIAATQSAALSVIAVRAASRTAPPVPVTAAAIQPPVRTASQRPQHQAPPALDGDSITRADAAALLGIPERSVRALGATGVLEDLPYDGRAARVTRGSVDAFLATRNGTKEAAR
jgi:hypothetical protein